MIFVTVGTTQYPFRRLIDWSIQQAKSYPNEKVVIQSGVYKVIQNVSDNILIQQSFAFPEVQEYIKKSDQIICHAGMGTIIQCWSFGKKPFVVPRLEKYGEHANDHETQICRYLYHQDKINILNMNSQLNLGFIKSWNMKVSDSSKKLNLIKYLALVC